MVFLTAFRVEGDFMIQRLSGILVISWVSPTLDSIQMHKSTITEILQYGCHNSRNPEGRQTR
jgi:hypothetical protein